jgi:para-aminobenzoate synthetase component 2
MHILLIDNNDSFTRNLEHLLAIAVPGCAVSVTGYCGLDQLDPAAHDLVVISPGPGTPADYPGYGRVLEAGRPVLGICLGMQIINEWRGGTTGRLDGCVHGKTDTIMWQGEAREVARYHSLHVTRPGQGLDVLARNGRGVIMALGSKPDRLLGYQFHPESFLTPDGGRFIHDGLAYLGLA